MNLAARILHAFENGICLCGGRPKLLQLFRLSSGRIPKIVCLTGNRLASISGLLQAKSDSRVLKHQFVKNAKADQVYLCECLFYSVWLKIPEMYPKYLGHRRAWMNWAVNAHPETRGVLIALNGKDEFVTMVKAPSAEKVVDVYELRGWI